MVLIWHHLVTGEVTSVHPLAKQWKESSLHEDLQQELHPILDQAIDQPEALAPRYATSLPTQVTFETTNTYCITYIYVCAHSRTAHARTHTEQTCVQCCIFIFP